MQVRHNLRRLPLLLKTRIKPQIKMLLLLQLPLLLLTNLLLLFKLTKPKISRQANK